VVLNDVCGRMVRLVESRITDRILSDAEPIRHMARMTHRQWIQMIGRFHTDAVRRTVSEDATQLGFASHEFEK
jgi:hypothetical protein